jgi:ATP phosphoribosyltransferase
VLADPDNDTEFFFLRPRDIATYVGSGQLEVGITGRDLLLDGDSDAEEVLALGFGARPSATPPCPGGRGPSRTSPAKRIATSYPGIVRRDLASAASRPRSIRSTVRWRPPCGSASPTSIADVVSTGTTLRQAGLESSASRSSSPRRC